MWFSFSIAGNGEPTAKCKTCDKDKISINPEKSRDKNFPHPGIPVLLNASGVNALLTTHINAMCTHLLIVVHFSFFSKLFIKTSTVVFYLNQF